MMEAMIPSQVGMSLRTLQKIKEASEAHTNKRGQRSPPKNEKVEKGKNERKREGTMLLYFSTLVLHDSTMFFMIESFLLCHYHMLVGIFII